MKSFSFLLGCLLFLAAFTNGEPVVEVYKIEGIVVDKNTGDPLIGANILLKGTATGAVTDLDGRFSLNSTEKCPTLEVSFVGYETETVKKACAGKEVRVEMTAAAVMEEVVVTGRAVTREHKMMAMSVSPAPANGQGIVAYGMTRMPEPVSRENYAPIEENRFRRAADAPLSTFSIDVDAASYSNLRRFLNGDQLPPADAVRVEEMINYFSYDYPQPAGEHPFEVVTEVGPCPWQPQHRLLHIGLQGHIIPADDLPASNLVFLIDASGSMQSADKLPLLQESFKLLTDQLRPQDKVAIVVYAGAAGTVLEPTPGDNKQKIKDAIDALTAGGSTAGAAGIQLAYQTARKNFVQDGNNRVLLATDGDFNVGVSSDAELVRLIERERETGIYLTVLGFGTGNYQDGKMQQLADKGNGNHAYIDNLNEAKKVLVSEFGGTVFTIAKDVKLQLEFNPARVAGYRLIGYENRLLNDEDFNDDKKDAGELGSGHTVTALYEIIPAGVESAFLTKVDDLKYQETTVKPGGDELLTVKLRYKKPTHDASRLIELPVTDGESKVGDNFRWSAAVAAFGMLLRDSEFKGQATWESIISLAESAKGKDPHGYRKEAIGLMKKAKELAEPEVVGKE